jgi:hypothetical protein
LGDCLIWAFFENYRINQFFELLLFHDTKLGIHFDQKNAWVTFWANFSQTHLVTLGVILLRFCVWIAVNNFHFFEAARI